MPNGQFDVAMENYLSENQIATLWVAAFGRLVSLAFLPPCSLAFWCRRVLSRPRSKQARQLGLALAKIEVQGLHWALTRPQICVVKARVLSAWCCGKFVVPMQHCTCQLKWTALQQRCNVALHLSARVNSVAVEMQCSIAPVSKPVQQQRCNVDGVAADVQGSIAPVGKSGQRGGRETKYHCTDQQRWTKLQQITMQHYTVVPLRSHNIQGASCPNCHEAPSSYGDVCSLALAMPRRYPYSMCCLCECFRMRHKFETTCNRSTTVFTALDGSLCSNLV